MILSMLEKVKRLQEIADKLGYKERSEHEISADRLYLAYPIRADD